MTDAYRVLLKTIEPELNSQTLLQGPTKPFPKGIDNLKKERQQTNNLNISNFNVYNNPAKWL